MSRVGPRRKRLPCVGGMLFLLVAGVFPVQAAAAPRATLVLESKDTAALARFYENALGLPGIASNNGSGVVVLDAAGTSLVLVPRDGKETGNRAAVRLLLPAEDLDDARERLTALGVPFREVSFADGGGRALFFQDPEGNRLGFVPPGMQAEAWLHPLQLGRGREVCSSSGRTELMVYAGAYGLRLGIALPAGFGLDLILQTEDTETAWAIPGITGLAGMGAAALWTREKANAGEGASLEIGPMPLPGGVSGGGFRVSLVRAGF